MNNEAREAGAEEFFNRGMKALGEGSSLAALSAFEKACDMDNRPVHCSFFGYCVAKERGQVQRGMQLCRDAISSEPENPVHYLNLGRVYLVGGNKKEALDVLRQGLGHGQSEDILALLESIGVRKSPVIASLGRDHPVNKYLGIILSKLGLR